MIPTLGVLGVILAIAGIIMPLVAPNMEWAGTAGPALALLCFLVVGVLRFHAIKRFSQQRSTRMGLNSFMSTLLVGAILVLLNFLAIRHAPEWDFSETQHFTLSRQTYQVLRQLTAPIEIRVFAHERSPKHAAFRDLLTTYAKESPNLNVAFIDPERQPQLAKTYGIRQIDTVVIESAGNKVYVQEASENDITNALLRATQGTQKRLIFLTGHGEKAVTDQQSSGLSRAHDALTKQGYEVKTHATLDDNTLRDAAAVAIVSPQHPLAAGEAEALESYLAQGGRVLLLVDPQNETAMDAVTARWGVTLGAGIVVDELHRLGRGSPTALQIRTFTGHDITDEFTVPILLPVSRHLDFDMNAGTDWEFVSLAQTSEESWAETDQRDATPEFDDTQDVRGPLTVAAALTRTSTPPGSANPGRIVIVGNSAFATNGYLTYPGNTDFFLKSVAWLAGEEHLVSITPKEPAFRPFVPNPSQEQALLFFQVLLLPLFTLFLGFSVWQRRRRL